MSGGQIFKAILIAIASLFAIDSVSANDKKALVGGRLIDGLLGAPIANSVILVDGDLIEAVGTKIGRASCRERV